MWTLPFSLALRQKVGLCLFLSVRRPQLRDLVEFAKSQDLAIFIFEEDFRLTPAALALDNFGAGLDLDIFSHWTRLMDLGVLSESIL